MERSQLQDGLNITIKTTVGIVEDYNSTTSEDTYASIHKSGAGIDL
jgi:hypothetical protein